jgi:acylglycerol lipase
MVTPPVEFWPAPGTARAAVVIVHGLGEHAGRYAHVAEYLNQRGYTVYGPDHPGHGRHTGRRAYFRSLTQPVENLAQVMATVKEEPVFIYAHSMGTLVTLAYALEHPHHLAGLIISGNPLHLDTLYLRPLVRIAPLLNRLAPVLPVGFMGDDGLTHDEANLADRRQDPYVYQGPVRIRMAHYLLAESQRLRQKVNGLQLPLLVVHGSADPVCPPSGAQLLYDQASSADKTLKIYPGLYHEPHNEPEKSTVLADIAAWLDARTK